MLIPIVLVALGVVSFAPESAGVLTDGLAFFLPRRPITATVSWLARYQLVGVMCLGVGVSLIVRRLDRRSVKKKLL